MDSVLNVFLEPLRYGFILRALLVSLVVGTLCSVIGSYVVMRGLAFMGDAMAHAVLPGVVLAVLAGLGALLGAVVTGVVVALLLGYVARSTGVSEDTSIGILFAGLFALGVVGLSVLSGLPVSLEGILLGRVLAVSQADLYLTMGLGVLVLAALFLLHKELVFATFDRGGASVLGLPVRVLDYLLLVLLALVIVIALQAVGIILVMAMLVTPAATAYLLARRLVTIMGVGALLGAGAAMTGMYLSYYLNVPSGAAMALTATGMFAVVALLRRRARPI